MPTAVRERKVELPFQDWPETDRAAWEALFAAGDVFEEAGGGRHWAAATRMTNRHHYARWLGWLQRHGRARPRSPAVGAGHARAGAIAMPSTSSRTSPRAPLPPC